MEGTKAVKVALSFKLVKCLREWLIRLNDLPIPIADNSYSSFHVTISVTL